MCKLQKYASLILDVFGFILAGKAVSEVKGPQIYPGFLVLLPLLLLLLLKEKKKKHLRLQ